MHGNCKKRSFAPYNSGVSCLMRTKYPAEHNRGKSNVKGHMESISGFHMSFFRGKIRRIRLPRAGSGYGKNIESSWLNS